MAAAEHETTRRGTSEHGSVRVRGYMPKKLTLGNNHNLYHVCPGLPGQRLWVNFHFLIVCYNQPDFLFFYLMRLDLGGIGGLHAALVT